MASIEYGDPVTIRSDTGKEVDLTDIFWSIVQEARWFEYYPEVSIGKMKQAGNRIGMALGHQALMPIINLMAPFIPEDYEDALRACWQDIVDACEAIEQEYQE